MRPIQFCFSILVAIAAVTCQAQVTPVVAKQRVTQDTLDAQGNVIKHRETLGIYLRNSSGSTVSKQYSPEGKLRTGQLVDYSRHKIYALSYEKLEAVEEANLTDGPHPEYLANTSTALGEETVNSLSCLVHPVFVKLNGTKRQIGRTYDSAQYGLTVKEDELIEPPGGPRTHLIVELSDIQFVEPDPKDFSLEKFSFLEKHCAACTKQGIAGTVETLK
jgi:hypothetical protein